MRRFETWKVRKLFVCALLVLLAVPAVAMAQQASAILGQVRDESGGVLPGVTVTVSSPSLQVKEVTDVTNAQGEYRITPLPIGTYSVSYSLEWLFDHAAGRYPARPGRAGEARYRVEGRRPCQRP